MLEFIRIGSAVPPVRVGDPKKNTQDVCRMIAQADEAKVDLLVFPELALSGYTCADLFFQESLMTACMQGLEEIMACSARHPNVTAVVGTPAVIEGQMYNCGAVISAGKMRGLVPKTYLPNYNEFSERRWFSSSKDMRCNQVSLHELGIRGEDVVPVGRDLLFKMGDGCVMGVEICEDLWTPLPASTLLTINGAEVIANLSASDEIIGKRAVRTNLVNHQSSVTGCIYAYCSSGCTESTQDLVFCGHSVISENGSTLAENEKQIDTDYLLIQDADLGKIRASRRKNKSVRDTAAFYGKMEPMRSIDCQCGALRSDGSLYPKEKHPFVPSDAQDRLERCMSIFNIQVGGLKQRLELLDAKPVLGISGGLDSTLALLVAIEANRQLGREPKDVHALIMPGFGTSQRTLRNARELTRLLGVSVTEVDIREAVKLHFRDIGHDGCTYDSVYENAQARERTQVLMDYAGRVGGIVVGTGDLSELALGWCTYNGDQMSMYAVNGSIPKTLMRWMVNTMAESDSFAPARTVLLDILDTPVSPELLPPDENGVIRQHTEEAIGPYELHDFFLFHMIRFACVPAKIYTLACRAFEGCYTPEQIKKYMKIFYHRFFTQQFKRSCMPDGVKVGSISLSPRGDWRMPSDASARIWLEEVENL